MSLRMALHTLADSHGLDAAGRRRLLGMAGLDQPPSALGRWLPRGLAVLAAALVGLGLVMWIAANWGTLGRMGRFALLLGFTAAMGLAAALRPAQRAPLGLLAFVGIGAVFAFFGQTYQTGADPWQLFALWAALALPLCLGARSDVLWAPWSLVVMTALSLWAHAQLGHRWRVEPGDLGVHGTAWLAAAAVVAALAAPLRPVTGAGAWGLRTAATLAVVLTTLTALGGLFGDPVAPHYLLGLVVLAGAAALLSLRAAFDVFVLSAVALALDTLLTAGLARLMFDDRHGDAIGSLLLIGLLAAGLLAGSVHLVLRLARRHAAVQAVAHG
ncbi:MAG: DUF2157 domain-containing protein [Rhizobacter sp.]|nr:DUF2157 domain-containing protein [Rhizobacter sp.]